MASNVPYYRLPDGEKVPVVGIGTVTPEKEDIVKALNAALEYGYRHIDTAYVYNNERIIGNVLKEWLSSGKIKREDLFLTTKLPGKGMYGDKVEQYLKESLENLQLDYVDLYLIHTPIGLKHDNENNFGTVNPETDFIEVWKVMEELVKNKRTRYIGLSNFNIQQIEKVLKICTIKPANLQIELHLYLQQNDLVNYCKQNKISVTAYCPLGNPSFSENMRRYNINTKKLSNIMDDPIVKEVAKKQSRTPAQILLRFLIQKGLLVIPKSVTPSRILENISLFDFQLDKHDMDELAKLDKGEEARICDFRFVGWHTHPDYPF